MVLTTEQLALLKQHGFQWYKDQSTDRVEASHIQDVIPAANGFTVVYKNADDKGNGIVLRYSTAKVKEIDFPENPSTTWIRVTWDNIEDERNADQ